MGKNVHEKRKRLLTKMKAACLAVVMCVSTLPVLTAQIQPVTAYAQEKTGTVNAGVTGLRIRSSTDTSSTANVITKVSGGFHFEILDTVYLADPVDSYYASRREHGVVVTLSCKKPTETCFCKAFGIDATNPGGDVACWMTDDELLLQANTEKGEALLASLSLLEDAADDAADSEKEKLQTILDKLPLGNLSTESFGGDKLMALFNSDKWESLSESCLACGTCTFVCPTCQCYDIRDYDTGHGVQRFRCWDSCMYSDFTLCAHGNTRPTQMQRFRQRFMHKLVYYPANNNGVFGCVGCGRCLRSCPISMNIVKVMKALEG